jgi:hypothetical protein
MARPGTAIKGEQPLPAVIIVIALGLWLSCAC